MVGGRAVVFGLESLPEGRRRASEWLFIVGAAVVAASLRLDRPGAPVLLAFVVVALPGILAYLAWRTVLASALVSFLPLYFAIAEVVRGGTLHAPALGLDRALPVEPAWTLAYASLCLSVLLPLLVVRDRGLLRRTMLAFLAVMSIGYVGFLAYPTMAPRPASSSSAATPARLSPRPTGALRRGARWPPPGSSQPWWRSSGSCTWPESSCAERRKIPAASP